MPPITGGVLWRGVKEPLCPPQTGCNPASALASFSKWSSPVPRPDRHEYLMDLWEQLQSSRAAGPREPLPLQHEVGGSLMLPCEFCSVQLEEEILFHHQVRGLRAVGASASDQEGELAHTVWASLRKTPRTTLSPPRTSVTFGRPPLP